MQVYVITMLYADYKGESVWVLGVYTTLKAAKDALELHLYERFESLFEDEEDCCQKLKEYVESGYQDDLTWEVGLDHDDDITRFEIHKTDLYES